VEESIEQINNNSEAGCGDASCGTSPLVADASSIIDMTKTPPTGKPATQNENKRKIETIAEEPSPKKIQEKGWLQTSLEIDREISYQTKPLYNKYFHGQFYRTYCRSLGP